MPFNYNFFPASDIMMQQASFNFMFISAAVHKGRQAAL